jgi:hypothetical protein
VLKRVVEGHPLSKQNTPEVIGDALRKEALQSGKKYAGSEAANTVNLFCNIINGKQQMVTANVHCEALLLALALAALDAQFDLGDSKLNDVCKVRCYACIEATA